MPRITQSASVWTAHNPQAGTSYDLFVDEGAPCVPTLMLQGGAGPHERRSTPQQSEKGCVASAMARNEQECVVLFSQLPRESWSLEGTTAAAVPTPVCVRHRGEATECVPDTRCLWHGTARLVQKTNGDDAGRRHGLLSLSCSYCRIVVPFVPRTSSDCLSDAQDIQRPAHGTVCATDDEATATGVLPQMKSRNGAAWQREDTSDEEEENGAAVAPATSLHERVSRPQQCERRAAIAEVAGREEEDEENEQVMQDTTCASLPYTKRLSLRFLLQNCRLPRSAQDRLHRLLYAHMEHTLCASVLPSTASCNGSQDSHTLPQAVSCAPGDGVQFWLAAFAHTSTIHDELVREAGVLHHKLCNEHRELPRLADNTASTTEHKAGVSWPCWVPPQTPSLLILQALQQAALVFVRETAIALHQVSLSGTTATHLLQGMASGQSDAALASRLQCETSQSVRESDDGDYHVFCQLCDRLFGGAMQVRLLRVVQRALPFSVSVSGLMQDAAARDSGRGIGPDVTHWVYPACLQRTTPCGGVSRKHARDAVWGRGAGRRVAAVGPSLLEVVYGVASDLLTTLFPTLEARLQTWMCTSGAAPLLRAWVAQAGTPRCCRGKADEPKAWASVALRRGLLSFLRAMRWWADWHEQGARYATTTTTPASLTTQPTTRPSAVICGSLCALPAPVWGLSATSNYVALNGLRWLLEEGPAAHMGMLSTHMSLAANVIRDDHATSGEAADDTRASRAMDEEQSVQRLACLLELLPCLCRHYLLRHEVQGLVLRTCNELRLHIATKATAACPPRSGPQCRAMAVRCLVMAIGWCVFGGPEECLCAELGVAGRGASRGAADDPVERSCNAGRAGLSVAAVRTLWARLRLEQCWRDWLLPLCQVLHQGKSGGASQASAAHVLCVAAELAEEALHTLRLLRHRVHCQHRMQTHDESGSEAGRGHEVAAPQLGTHSMLSDAEHESEPDVTDTRSIALSSLTASTRTATTNTTAIKVEGAEAMRGRGVALVASTVRVHDLRCLRTGVVCLRAVLQAALDTLAASLNEGSAADMAGECGTTHHSALEAECRALLQSCSNYAACITLPITVRVDDLHSSLSSLSDSDDDDAGRHEVVGGSDAESESVTLSSLVYDESYSSASTTTTTAAHTTARHDTPPLPHSRAAQRAHRRRPRSDTSLSDTVSSSTVSTTPSPRTAQPPHFSFQCP